ncbi:hypothetical protein Y032_0793g2385 [Ancylostoma ceylanicum]|uniref:PiggyBac transposable element-derived protein domain-containing protein n=1 Tax=Ancylostoma ceylanicum TaxID=53326 RepID=A0A016WC50_9BILA|nr:hypothetical protein Y032_0793g2385 [Ancylostoma ceylanicum]
MSTAPLLLLFLTFTSAWRQQYYDRQNTTLSCACVLRDALVELTPKMPKTTAGTTTITTPLPTTTESADEEDEGETSRKFIPYKYWTLYKRNIHRAKINPESYMDRFLSLFRGDTATTTPSFLVQEDSPMQSPITNLGKRIINKYFNKLKSQWNLLDRFVCSCDGDVLAIMNAKTYITMRLVHD